MSNSHHRRAAEHYDQAAHHHREAARHFEIGLPEQGGYHAYLAEGHAQLARQQVGEAVRKYVIRQATAPPRPPAATSTDA